MPGDTLDIRPMLLHVVPYTLVLFRLAGIFIAAPILSGAFIPRRHRALMGAMLAAAVYPGVMAHVRAPAAIDIIGLAPLLAGEALIGFSIGVIASLPLAAMELAGVIAGHQMGFGLSRVYNPETDADAELLGQLLIYVAIGAFLSLGGFEAMIGTLLATFVRVPVGAIGPADAPLDLFVGVLAGGFDLAARVAAPVTGIVLLIAVVLGVIGKTVPQVNVLTVGFTVKIVGGLGLMAVSMYAIGAACAEHITSAMQAVSHWALDR